jgi:hypothetical protein
MAGSGYANTRNERLKISTPNGKDRQQLAIYRITKLELVGW